MLNNFKICPSSALFNNCHHNKLNDAKGLERRSSMRQLVHHHDVGILRDLPEIGYMHTFLLTYHPFSNQGNSANAECMH